MVALDGKGNDINVKVRGGNGADKAIVRVKPIPASPADMTPGKLTAEIRLGGGDDVVIGVTVTNPDGTYDFVDENFYSADRAIRGSRNDRTVAVHRGRTSAVGNIPPNLALRSGRSCTAD